MKKITFEQLAALVGVSHRDLARMLCHPLSVRPTIEHGVGRYYLDEATEWASAYKASLKTPSQPVKAKPKRVTFVRGAVTT